MRIIFLINVDWFFCSHFLHLAQRAQKEGYEVTLASAIEKKRSYLISQKISFLDLPTRRRGIFPVGFFNAIWIVTRELKRSPNTLVHAFGLFGIIVGTLSCFLSLTPRKVFYITGRGYSAVSMSLRARFVRVLSRVFCSYLADNAHTRWIAENANDLESLIPQAVSEGRTSIVGGAGINPSVYVPSPLPPAPPIKIAFVGRLIWSKGVDLAVKAVEQARSNGCNIELSLIGPLDDGNPAGYSEQQIREFQTCSGTRWVGSIENISDIWSQYHFAILPSRGGEGVPRSLIEAAACGRLVITTNVPGCRELAEVTGGYIVPKDDINTLCKILCSLNVDQYLEERGRKAREVILQYYTEDKNWIATHNFYKELQNNSARL